MSKMKFTDCVDIVGSTPPEFMGSKIYVSTGALKCEHINYTQTENITYNDRPSRANLSVNVGDILFAKMQGTKKSIIIDTDTSNHIYSTGFVAVHPKDDIISKECLYYLVTSECFLNRKDKNCTGATQKAITNAGLDKIYINVPERVVQNRIVSKLDKITHFINICNTILEKLDLLVKARFVEMFGDPVDNPMKWNTMLLKNACLSIVDCPHSTPHYTNDNTGYMCIRTSIVKKNDILWDKIEFIPKEEYEQRIKRRKPQKGDIVYTREGAILGIATIIDRECNVALGQRSMLLSPNTRICLPEFISNVMNSDSFFNHVTQGVSGSASPHINVADIREFNIMMPPLALQKQFVAFVEQTNKLKLAVKRVLEKAEMLKKALMQEYFR